MSFSNRLPPSGGQWYMGWEPSMRPIQLPLPKLNYDSHFEVWEWRLKTLLKHNSLLGFIEAQEPSNVPDTRSFGEIKEAAAATHCLALLESSVSDHILADILTLSPDGKPSNDPYVLFKHIKDLVHDIQLNSEANNYVLCDYLNRADQFCSVQALFQTLDGLDKEDYRPADWRNLILIAALLVKRRFPSCLPASVKHYISKVKVKTLALTEVEWKSMVYEFKNVS